MTEEERELLAPGPPIATSRWILPLSQYARWEEDATVIRYG
jgi:hypothetical protein